MYTANVVYFRTDGGGEYAFDGVTGTAFPVNEIMKKAIKLFENVSEKELTDELKKEFSEDEVKGTVKFLSRWKNAFGGIYRSQKDAAEERTGMENCESSFMKEYMESGNLFQIVINLTEDCNYRCKYCYLSGEYEYTRNRTTREIDFETGKKGLDMFFNYLKTIEQKIPGKKAGITFYGGEPLLNFHTMKRLIEYAKLNSPVPLIFNMTTNGYLLDDEAGDYVVQNKINMVVSFDGTKENHDRNRVLPNNVGTYDVVYKNIKRFEERHPNYSYWGVICVYDLKTDLMANVEFFEKEKLPRIIFLNPVVDLNTGYYERFTDDDSNYHRKQVEEMLRLYMQAKKDGKPVSNFLSMFFDFKLAPVVVRPRHEDKKPLVAPYTNACVPGMKFSVRVDGTIDICERVNETFPIGHVNEGLNYNAMRDMMDKYNKAITANCHNCTFSKNCTMCFALCNESCSFCLPENWCNRATKELTNALGVVYSILEKKTDAFKEFEGKLPQSLLYYA